RYAASGCARCAIKLLKDTSRPLSLLVGVGQTRALFNKRFVYVIKTFRIHASTIAEHLGQLGIVSLKGSQFARCFSGLLFQLEPLFSCSLLPDGQLLFLQVAERLSGTIQATVRGGSGGPKINERKRRQAKGCRHPRRTGQS